MKDKTNQGYGVCMGAHCQDCRFFAPGPQKARQRNDRGECHKSSPHPKFGFPKVSTINFCGDYEPKSN